MYGSTEMYVKCGLANRVVTLTCITPDAKQLLPDDRN